MLATDRPVDVASRSRVLRGSAGVLAVDIVEEARNRRAADDTGPRWHALAILGTTGVL
jgi:hypothetical protein